MKFNLTKEQWQSVGEKAGWTKTAQYVAKNHYVRLMGSYDPSEYSYAMKALSDKLVDGKVYNLGSTKLTWSATSRSFDGSNFSHAPDFGDVYTALKNDGYSDEQMVQWIKADRTKTANERSPREIVNDPKGVSVEEQQKPGVTLQLCLEALGRQGGTVHQIMRILRATKVLAESEYNESNQDQLQKDLTMLKYVFHD